MTRWQAIQAVLDKMRSALGTKEYPANSNDNFIVQWYNANVDRIGRGPWCQMTTTWAYWTALPKQIVRGRAYTVWAANDFAERYLNGTWHWHDETPQPGDQVFFDWGGRKGSRAYIDHVGIVEKVLPDGTFYTLEGNFRNSLIRMHRDTKYVVGFGRPDWGIVASYSGSGGSTAPASNKKIPGTDLYLLKVDGDWGPKTETAFRRLMGKRSHKYAVQALQIWLNKKGYRDRDGRRLDTDGKGLSSNSRRRYPSTGWTRTISAIQRWAGTKTDGYLSQGESDVVKWLQTKMNTGKFPE